MASITREQANGSARVHCTALALATFSTLLGQPLLWTLFGVACVTVWMLCREAA